jgi:hypothetical protein
MGFAQSCSHSTKYSTCETGASPGNPELQLGMAGAMCRANRSDLPELDMSNERHRLIRRQRRLRIPSWSSGFPGPAADTVPACAPGHVQCRCFGHLFNEQHTRHKGTEWQRDKGKCGSPVRLPMNEWQSHLGCYCSDPGTAELHSACICFRIGKTRQPSATRRFQVKPPGYRYQPQNEIADVSE